ncbi:MAG: FHA domain-containing protein [Methylacidiphilales bacterium]|nr:FHA domain-containing protein [Candidatus Methylacidiphilales bacterium]
MEPVKDFGVTPPTWMRQKKDASMVVPRETNTSRVTLNIQDLPPPPGPPLKHAPTQPCCNFVLKIHKASFDFPDVVIPCRYSRQPEKNLAIGSSYWVVLGRAPDVLRHTGLCLVIPDPTISRTHAAILNHEGCLYVCDLSENNPPTIVRGSKLIHVAYDPTALYTTDYLGLGGVLFTFAELAPSPANLEKPA